MNEEKSSDNLPVNYSALENFVSKLSSQIEALSQANTALEKHFTDLLKSQSETHQETQPPNISTAVTASSIVDELSEREHKRNNIIVYNLPEVTEPSLEEKNFVDLCNSIVKADLNIHRIFRIGRKMSNRVRPLLVSFACEANKLSVLSSAPRLRFYGILEVLLIN